MTRTRKRICAGVVALPIICFSLFYIISCTGSIRPYEEKVNAQASSEYVIVFGDCRPKLLLEFWRHDYEHERILLLQKLAEENPGLIINSGDLVSQGYLKGAWRQFDREHAPIFDKKIPYYPCLGNHEYWGNKKQAMENYFSHFPFLLEKKWYEVPYKTLLFICLDSNFNNLTRKEIEDQDKWYKDHLDAAEKNSDIRAIIVCTHHPPYTHSTVHKGDPEVVKRFVDKKTPKVRAFICGHVHTYERFVKDGIQFVVSGGGGAPLTPVNPSSTEEPKDQYKGPDIRSLNYCLLHIEKSRVTVTVRMLKPGDQWETGDSFVLDFP